MSGNDIDVCVVDKSIPSSSRCTKVSIGNPVKSVYVKRYSAEGLTKIGLISVRGDNYTVRLDESGNLIVMRDNVKVPVLRNGTLKNNLIRLLNKYNTSFLQIEAI